MQDNCGRTSRLAADQVGLTADSSHYTHRLLSCVVSRSVARHCGEKNRRQR